MSLSGLPLTHVYMGTPDTKRRAEDSFAESVQNHSCRIWSIIPVSDSSVCQYFNGLSCIFTTIVAASQIWKNCCCTSWRSNFQIGNCGTERWRWQLFTSVRFPLLCCRGLLAGGRGRLKKDLQTLQFPYQHWNGLLEKEWLHEEQGREPVARSCQTALCNSVTTQNRSTLYLNLFSYHCKTGKKRRT